MTDDIMFEPDILTDNDLLYVCQQNKLDRVKSLLPHNRDQIDEAFDCVCEAGHFEIAKYLLDEGANPLGTRNALGRASEYGHVKIVQLILEKGVDASMSNNHAIKMAGYGGHLEVMEVLLKHGADPTETICNSIHRASRCFSDRERKIVQLLLDKGVDINNVHPLPLSQVCFTGNLALARMLLDYGADPTLRHSDVLRVASHYGHIKLVQMLLEDGRVDPSVPNEKDSAIGVAKNKEIRTLLLEYKYRVDGKVYQEMANMIR